MNETEKRALMISMAEIVQSSDIYNHYARDTGLNQAKAMAISTNSNTTAVQRPYWEQSTTAGPKQYSYDSDDDSYREKLVDQYRYPNPQTTDNTSGMPLNWQEMWDRYNDKSTQPPWVKEEDEDTIEASKQARASQRRLLEEIARMQEEQRRQQQRERDERRIDEAIMPTINEPIPVAVPATTPPVEIAPIEDNLRPLRFGPLVPVKP